MSAADLRRAAVLSERLRFASICGIEREVRCMRELAKLAPPTSPRGKAKAAT